MIQKELIGDLKLKWDHMQQAMQKINAGGCLLTVDVNLYYTTGRIYTGNTGKAPARSRRTDIQRLYTPAKDLQSERDRKRNRNDA